MKVWFAIAVGLVGASALAQESTSTTPVGDGLVGKDVSETIVSLDQIEQIARNTQKQFWQLVPPTDDPLYIHPESVVRAVDWKTGKWPDGVLKQMVAEMETVNRSMYPIYRLTVVEMRTGELAYFNSYGQEVWRTPAPFNYNPYLFAIEQYAVETAEELTAQQKIFGRSSNVGSEILLLPEAFVDSYEEDALVEAQAETLSEPVAMSFSGSSTNLLVAIEPTTNSTVEVELGWPDGFTNHLEIYSSTNLVAGKWILAHTNIPTLGTNSFVWEDTTTNWTKRYYVSGNADLDSDGDGLPDAREIYLYRTDPLLADTDGDGLSDGAEIANGTNPLYADSDGDGMGDGAEAALTNSVAVNGSGGVLVVVPDTGWYHATDPSLNLVYLGE